MWLEGGVVGVRSSVCVVKGRMVRGRRVVHVITLCPIWYRALGTLYVRYSRICTYSL